MLAEILTNYGVFLLKLLTAGAVIVAVVALVMGLREKQGESSGKLKITDLSEKYKNNEKKLAQFRLSDDEVKAIEKAEKQAKKTEQKALKAQLKKGEKIEKTLKPCVYVINFKGDIQASAATTLADEVSTILAVAKENDEVLVRLESAGGVVHGYGLAASQLARLKEKGIKLTVAVDKVAASGGYMMACVADKIVSAPFAILGSIGVVAQIPNVHRWLKKHDVDVDVMTAGEYKRTLTVLGENSEKARKKFQQDLEETHQLFKNFVTTHRPQLDMDKVATGEHWFGQQALTLGLVDQIATSDALILAALADKDVLEVKLTSKQSLIQKLGKQAEESSDHLLTRWLNKNSRELY